MTDLIRGEGQGVIGAAIALVALLLSLRAWPRQRLVHDVDVWRSLPDGALKAHTTQLIEEEWAITTARRRYPGFLLPSGLIMWGGASLLALYVPPTWSELQASVAAETLYFGGGPIMIIFFVRVAHERESHVDEVGIPTAKRKIREWSVVSAIWLLIVLIAGVLFSCFSLVSLLLYPEDSTTFEADRFDVIILFVGASILNVLLVVLLFWTDRLDVRRYNVAPFFRLSTPGANAAGHRKTPDRLSSGHSVDGPGWVILSIVMVAVALHRRKRKRLN